MDGIVRNFQELGAWRGIGAQLVVGGLIVFAGYLAWTDHRVSSAPDVLTSSAVDAGPQRALALAGDGAGNEDHDDTSQATFGSDGSGEQATSTSPLSALVIGQSSTSTSTTDSSAISSTKRPTSSVQPTTIATSESSSTDPLPAERTTTTVQTKTTTTVQTKTTTAKNTTTTRRTTTERTPTTEGRPAPVNCQLEGELASVHSETTLRFTITNRSSHDYELFWLNHSGRRVSYGIIETNSTHDQYTYRNHPWILADPDTGLCRYLLPEATSGLVISMN